MDYKPQAEEVQATIANSTIEETVDVDDVIRNGIGWTIGRHLRRRPFWPIPRWHSSSAIVKPEKGRAWNRQPRGQAGPDSVHVRGMLVRCQMQ